MRKYSQQHNLSSSNDNNEHQLPTYLRKYTTKNSLRFHPTNRRFSDTNENRSFSIYSISNNRRHSSSHHTDNYGKDLPLIMITDIDSSHTNVVELETFEDRQRVMTNIAKRIERHLKTPY